MSECRAALADLAGIQLENNFIITSAIVPTRKMVEEWMGPEHRGYRNVFHRRELVGFTRQFPAGVPEPSYGLDLLAQSWGVSAAGSAFLRLPFLCVTSTVPSLRVPWYWTTLARRGSLGSVVESCALGDAWSSKLRDQEFRQ